MALTQGTRVDVCVDRKTRFQKSVEVLHQDVNEVLSHLPFCNRSHLMCSYHGVCWWCLHKSPDGNYVHCPVKLRVTRNPKKKTMSGLGFFCSRSCALAWGLEKRIPNVRSLMYLLSSRNHNDPYSVMAAPEQHELFLFGGPLSIKEFRRKKRTPLKSKKIGTTNKKFLMPYDTMQLAMDQFNFKIKKIL